MAFRKAGFYRAKPTQIPTNHFSIGGPVNARYDDHVASLNPDFKVFLYAVKKSKAYATIKNVSQCRVAAVEWR
jgi:hypothetical protein